MRILTAIALISALVQTACLSENGNDRIMGDRHPADLVVIFKPGTTLEERQHFDEETIGVRVPGMDGFGLKDGIRGELAIPSICSNQDGVALELRDDITDAQMQEITDAITNSPIVDRIVENQAPGQVSCRNSTSTRQN
jgi:hypothetical protein